MKSVSSFSSIDFNVVSLDFWFFLKGGTGVVFVL